MRRPFLVLSAAVIFGLAGCSTNDPDPSTTPESTTAINPSTSTTTSRTTSSAPTVTTDVTTPEPAPAVPALPATAQEQTRSIWAPPGQGIQCPGTDAFVWDFADCNPSNGVIDPAEFARLGQQQNQEPAHDGVPIADGGTCPAYLCGYGHDEQGNRNPTSGEIQTQHGCEQGYITDPELCAAVGSPIQ